MRQIGIDKFLHRHIFILDFAISYKY